MKMKKACVIPEILQGLSGMIAMEGGNAIELSGTILAQLNQLLTGYRTTATQFPA
ncbi:MAG: hypothetical protein IIC11_10580 [Proteobacteria bacterium]|nr:hypothetical protein [Pseudomonadota bacterium]